MTIKNVSTKTVTMKYTQPATRYFQIGYPKKISLSAGMSATVAVTFCPVRAEKYQDQIDFTSTDGQHYFTIELRYDLANPHLCRAPSSILGEILVLECFFVFLTKPTLQISPFSTI